VVVDVCEVDLRVLLVVALVNVPVVLDVCVVDERVVLEV
jgi:hypothetical protein